MTRPQWIVGLVVLGALGLPNTHGFAAQGSSPEVLAGDDDKAVPTAQPSPAADARSSVSVTRSAQAAPSFRLPDFVVTGSGERKALAQRDGQGGGLDTSGGLRTSPGEKGAGKDQLDTKAERSSAEERTYTVKADDGWLRGAYGLANTAALDAYLGQSRGPLTWSVQGGTHNTDGAMPDPALASSQRRDVGLKSNLSYDSSALGLLELEAQGEGRVRRWTRAPFADAWLERDQAQALGTWRGQWDGTGLGLQVSGQRAGARVAGFGTVYTEEGGSLALDAQRTVSGHTGQTTLLASFSAEALSQRALGQRQLLLLSGSFRSRFEPFNRAKLTLGLGLDAVTGDSNEMLLGPRVEWQQRFSPAWAWNARFSSGLDISRLRTSTWNQDYRLPDASLPVSRRVADLKAGLQWQAMDQVALEAGAFAKQNEGYFLPDDPSRRGLWFDVPVRNYREIGVELKERWQLGTYWEETTLHLLRPEVSDLPGATATFAPTWTGKFSAGGRQGLWHETVAVEARSEMETSLHGGWTLPAAASLTGEIAYDFSEALSVFVEARNLTLAPWGDAPGYLEPAPYAGIGLEYNF